MEVFVGRQPILDEGLRTFAYELLFRSADRNHYDGGDPAMATAAVIAHTFLSIGAKNILGRRPAFINFPGQLLTEDTELPLPPRGIVIEILETVTPDEQVVRQCRRLRSQGYQLALDDFVDRPEFAPLVDLADYVKVDFRSTPPPECRRLARRFSARGIRMLAEKVETQEEYAAARNMGYRYFQGYFFARPQIVSVREVAANKLQCLRVLRELHRPELDFDRLETLIRQELSLAHKLLRYVNSAAFGFLRPIDSIERALVVLGEANTRKWVSLAAMPSLVAGRPPELVRTALVRGRFCETAAAVGLLAGRQADCFLVGLFSLLDAMVGRPMPELCAELGLSGDVREALETLGGRRDGLGGLLGLCLALEAAGADLGEQAAALGLSAEQAAMLHLDAMSWAEGVYHNGAGDGS